MDFENIFPNFSELNESYDSSISRLKNIVYEYESAKDLKEDVEEFTADEYREILVKEITKSCVWIKYLIKCAKHMNIDKEYIDRIVIEFERYNRFD